MQYDFLVLAGLGMQGKIVSRDLIESGFPVCLSYRSDFGKDEFSKRFPTAGFEKVDLQNISDIVNVIKKTGANVVVNCAEGDWNVNAYKACLEAGAHILDLGSDIPMTKEQLAMDSEFKAKGLTAITGCGSAPGINNVMLSFVAKEFDSISMIQSGFAWNSNIKKFVVPFSIPSIIEEFTDPAPVIENGEWIDKVPLDNITDCRFEIIGEQKCFPVRHPETLTFFEDFKSKGVKDVYFYAGFPEHSVSPIRAAIDLGFAGKEPIQIEGTEVKALPVNMLTSVLKHLPKPEGYEETENIWVLIEGMKNGQKQKMQMECIAPTLPGWEDAGCNIDTGMPASIMAQMVKKGTVSDRGSFNPGQVVPPQEFFGQLKKRGLMVYENGAPIKPEYRLKVNA